MKKLILMVAMAACISVALAAPNPGTYDTTPVVGGACMVEVSSTNVIRYLNVLYIRDIELRRTGPNGLPEKTVTINMAGNYRNYSEFSIYYTSGEEARLAAQRLAALINSCKGR